MTQTYGAGADIGKCCSGTELSGANQGILSSHVLGRLHTYGALACWASRLCMPRAQLKLYVLASCGMASCGMARCDFIVRFANAPSTVNDAKMFNTMLHGQST